MAHELLAFKEDTIATGSSLAAGATSTTLTTGAFTFTETGKQYLVFDYDVAAKREICLCTVSGTAITAIERAQDGTSDVAHSAGAKVLLAFVPGHYRALLSSITSYSPSAAGTATLTLNTSNVHRITMPAGNITIALSNARVGQCFLIDIIQDSVGSRTVTWFTTIKWAGGSAPTLTTTANKIDTIGFIVTSAGNYQGYYVGANM